MRKKNGEKNCRLSLELSDRNKYRVLLLSFKWWHKFQTIAVKRQLKILDMQLSTIKTLMKLYER